MINIKLLGCMVFTAIASLGATFSDTPTEQSKYLYTYLSDSITTTSYTTGVYLKRSDINLGYSKTLAGYEVNELTSTNNKFIRLANFDSASGINESKVDVLTNSMGKTSEINYSISYRFLIGKINYNLNDVVLSVSYRGATKTYTYNELTVSTKRDVAFNTLQGTLVTDSTVTSNDFIISFNYKKASALSNPTTYIDIDNVNVSMSNNNYCIKGNMESVVADTSGTLVSTHDLVNDNRLQYENLLLNEEEIDKFNQNSIFTNTTKHKFEYYDTYYKLPRGASSSDPFGVSSTASNSNLYLLHSYKENNSFMRLRNYDGTNLESTAFSNYFYDNENEVALNLPSTSYLYYSFKYRLYMNEEQQEKYYAKKSPLMFFSTRHASANHSGYLYLDNLIINELGDDTWRTYEGLVDIRATTTTSYITITYYHLMSALDTSSYFDIDDLTLSNQYKGKNYVYGNGEFNFDLENNKHILSIETGSNDLEYNVVNKPSLGSIPSSNDDKLIFKTGNSISYIFDDVKESGVYQLILTGKKLDNLKIYLDGLSGDSYNLKNKNQFIDYKVYDDKVIIYLAASFDFNSLDFANNELDDVVLTGFELSKVDSVNVISGNYSSFMTEYNAILNEININNLTISKKHQLEIMQKRFALLNEYSSQNLLDSAINELRTFMLSSDIYKADLTNLNKAIDDALYVLSIIDTLNYKQHDYIIFDDLLRTALAVTENDSQTYVDEITASLIEATKKVLGE